MSDDRFANPETLIAFHEDTIQKLNDAVYKQQLAIDRLEEKVKAFTQLLRAPGQLLNGESEPESG
ncbi:MAG: SlyX family protein [Desulfomonilia bacterium]|nr:SlyX family protein [Deltaproteobacteria bacterium]